MTAETGVEEIEDITLGATAPDTGGGGDSHAGRLIAKQAIEEFGSIELLPPDESDADDFVIPTAQMGAPTASVEKLPSGREAVASMGRIERELEKIADVAMPTRCGDINSTFPLTVAARRGLPVVDADGMGRTFPELQHEMFNIYGVSGTPVAVGDEQGSTCLIETEDNDQLEWLARGVIVRMGGVAYVSDYPMTGTQANETAISGTMSFVKNLGRVLRLAGDDTMSAIREVTRESTYGEAWSPFEGKTVDIQRRTEHGFAFGYVNIGDLDGDEGSTMRIEFQNENLSVAVGGNYVATVSDLITVLDRGAGGLTPTESLRYEARVRALGIRAPEIVRTPAAFDVWGPAPFGLDVTYGPLADHP